MRPQVRKVEQVPAVHAVVKVKDGDVAVRHVDVVIAVAVVKVNEAEAFPVGRQRVEPLQAVCDGLFQIGIQTQIVWNKAADIFHIVFLKIVRPAAIRIWLKQF